MSAMRNAEILRALALSNLPHGEKSLILYLTQRGADHNRWTALSGTWDSSVAFDSEMTSDVVKKARLALMRKGWVHVSRDASGRPSVMLTDGAADYFRTVLRHNQIRRAFKPDRWKQLTSVITPEESYQRYEEAKENTPYGEGETTRDYVERIARMVYQGAIRHDSPRADPHGNRADSHRKRADSHDNRADRHGGNVVDLRKRGG